MVKNVKEQGMILLRLCLLFFFFVLVDNDIVKILLPCKLLLITVISIRALLLQHHGVKQCFHTMDVAESYWSIFAIGSHGPHT